MTPSSPTNEDRVTRIAAQRVACALGGLHRSYTPEGVGVWLFGRLSRQLGERTPQQLLMDGDIDAFVRAVERLGDWSESEYEGPR